MPKKRPDDVRGQRKSVTTLKGSVEWAEWLAEFAGYRRTSVMALIDHALTEHAKATGFSPPPRR